MTHRNDLIPNDAVSVSPSDSAFVDLVGIMVGGAGNVALVTGAGTSTTIAMAVGQILGLRITQIKSTGTTATGIIGFKA